MAGKFEVFWTYSCIDISKHSRCWQFLTYFLKSFYILRSSATHPRRLFRRRSSHAFKWALFLRKLFHVYCICTETYSLVHNKYLSQQCFHSSYSLYDSLTQHMHVASHLVVTFRLTSRQVSVFIDGTRGDGCHCLWKGEKHCSMRFLLNPHVKQREIVAFTLRSTDFVRWSNDACSMVLSQCFCHSSRSACGWSSCSHDFYPSFFWSSFAHQQS